VKLTIHVAYAAMKANQFLGLIRITFNYLDCNLTNILPSLGCTWNTQILYGIPT